MLVETKAKVAVFSVALGAYLPQFPQLVPEFEAQYEAFKATLPDTVEIVDGGMCTTKEAAQAAGDKFRAGKRHTVITGVVEGGDLQVTAEIEDWCRAAQVRRRLRYTNLNQVGRPYPGMMDLYIDETNLYHRMGLFTKQFDWERMWGIADDVTDEAVIAAKVADIHGTFDILGDYDEASIREMARCVVSFEQWVKEEELGFASSHYDGFAQGKAGGGFLTRFSIGARVEQPLVRVRSDAPLRRGAGILHRSHQKGCQDSRRARGGRLPITSRQDNRWGLSPVGCNQQGTVPSGSSTALRR